MKWKAKKMNRRWWTNNISNLIQKPVKAICSYRQIYVFSIGKYACYDISVFFPQINMIEWLLSALIRILRTDSVYKIMQSWRKPGNSIVIFEILFFQKCLKLPAYRQNKPLKAVFICSCHWKTFPGWKECFFFSTCLNKEKCLSNNIFFKQYLHFSTRLLVNFTYLQIR